MHELTKPQQPSIKLKAKHIWNQIEEPIIIPRTQTELNQFMEIDMIFPQFSSVVARRNLYYAF